jgi:hypothetical protein
MLVYDCNFKISAHRSPGDEGILDDDEEPKGPKSKDTEHFFNLIPRCWNARTAGNKTVNSQTLVKDSITLGTIMVGSFFRNEKSFKTAHEKSQGRRTDMIRNRRLLTS